MLSLSGGGRRASSRWPSAVSFRLHDAAGRDWLPGAEIVLRRAYSSANPRCWRARRRKSGC
ncbi:MAG: hypothetical protein IPJ62_05760 [Betaproteobacteria bacterium]|nr:hypothetical protein [Betaproteobacteria bacterium]